MLPFAPALQRGHRGTQMLQGALFAALACAGFGMVAQAAAPPAPRNAGVNGTLVSFEGNTLQIKTEKQGQISVALAPNAQIVDQEPGQLSDVVSGKFIGTTAVQEADGSLHAREIHVFAESMRGAGEGHRPMAAPKTTMTNGNIEAVTGSVTQSGTGADNRMKLHITYKGGQSDVLVGPSTTVTVMTVSTTAVLQPGKNVTVLAPQHGPDGTLTTNTVIVRGQTRD